MSAKGHLRLKAARKFDGAAPLAMAAGAGIPVDSLKKTRQKPLEAAKSGLDALRLPRKTRERAEKLLTQAFSEARERRYAKSKKLYDDVIEITGTALPVIHFNRLSVASTGADYEFVASNYLATRKLARTEDEQVFVDYAWLDCLVASGHLKEAHDLASHWLKTTTKPRPQMENVIGLVLSELGHVDEAIDHQQAILKRHPDFTFARWTLSLNQLKRGIIPEGFENYETRWSIDNFPSERRSFEFPQWRGEPVEGKKILVWREQGIGDEIRFASLIPDLVEAGAEVVFECSPKLVPLFKRSFPKVRVRATLPEMQFSKLEGFHYHSPVGSLALHLRPTLDRMITGRRSSLQRSESDERAVRAAMGSGPGPVIGICWRSTMRNLRRDQHYLKPENLALLQILKNAQFLCLQYDECADEVRTMTELGLPIAHFIDIDQKNDLVSAAGLIGACDLVISAGTAVAELSAALGKATIVFGKKDSQIKLGTEGVPWHPNSLYLDFEDGDGSAIAKQILMNWPAISAWAAGVPGANPDTVWGGSQSG